MPERVKNYDILGKCIKDILSLIKPVEDDQSKRLSAIQELEISIQSVPALRGAAARPFGSFLSNLYSKSGDLDLSVQLMNSSNLQISKKKKQTLLRELRKNLQVRGVARYMEFIPYARVPVLQYVSNRFGISCDLSIDNYPGRIKSRILYWINSLDERFSDMVLLVKEWAKAQNINDPKTGTLNSYSLCLLVLFHFQTCEPSILPPLKEIYEGNITEDFADMTLYNEQHLDEVCAANILKFQSQNKEERNESSLCHLLATFFHKFSDINTLSNDVISTYTGQFNKVQDDPFWTAKSYSLIVEDPVERPDNAARAVSMKGLNQISSSFTDANHKFVSLEHTDRNNLLEMLCTPAVCSKLGGRVIGNSYSNTPQITHQHAMFTRRVAAKPSDSTHRHVVNGGFTGSKAVHNHPQGHTNATGRRTTGQPGQHRNHNLGHVSAKPSDSTDHNVVMGGFTESRVIHNPPQGHTNATGRQTTGQPGQNRDHNLGHVAAKPSDSTHHNVVMEGFTGSSAVHNPPEEHTNATGRQTIGQPGQHQNHNLSPGYTNTTGHQTQGQSWRYQNHNHQQVYTSGRQAAGLYQNQSRPQVRTAWIQAGGPYQNNTHQQVYNTGHQTAGPYQNNTHQQVYNTGHQTARPYQNHSHQQVYTSGVLQTPGSYQNFYNPTPQNHGHPQVYTTGHQTQGQYQNQQVRQYTPGRQANRNGVASAYATVPGGIQNGQACDSLSQASSSRTRAKPSA